MKKTGIDTIIYDFDGTVMDTNDVIIKSWQHTYMTLTGHEGNMDYILSTFGEPLELSMKNAFPDVPMDKSVEVYRNWHRENFGEMIRLFPGIREMLAEAKARGYKTGIATSRVAKTLYEGIEKYGIAEYFDEIVTVEDVTKHKPDPEVLYRILDKLNSSPARAVMLGDSRFDIQCARNAGVKAVLVGWSATLAGMTREDFKEEERPDHVIHSPDELFEII